MKKYRIVTLLFLCSFLISCSKDDGVPTPDPLDEIKSANLKATGASANDILSNTTFTKLIIEIAYVEGFRPSPAAMANFEQFLRDRTFKQDIQLVYRVLPSPNEEDLTLQEIADLEDENRTIYNSEDTVAIYIFFADAPAEGDNEEEGLVTLGAVYRNTSMIIYQSTIQNLSSQSILVPIEDIETSALHHEFGHLFGLVDLGTSPVNMHEDATNPNHCNVDGCLMRAELQFGSGIMGVLEKRTSKGILAVPEIDAECILDLQSNGGR